MLYKQGLDCARPDKQRSSNKKNSETECNLAWFQKNCNYKLLLNKLKMIKDLTGFQNL